MCGRYTLQTPMLQLLDTFRFDSGPLEFRPPRYNVAPTQTILAVTPGPQGREAKEMRWGLIPHWTRDPGKAMINAKAETLAQKTSFKDAYARRRCIILADGFFEWMNTPNGKQPIWIGLESANPFAMAGIWQPWTHPTEGNTMTCAIVTVPANNTVKPIHDRMPAILTTEQIDLWLDPAQRPGNNLRNILTPFTHEDMTYHPVTKLVNNTRNDSTQVIAALDEKR